VSARGFLYKLSRGLQASPMGRVLKSGAHRLFPSLYYRLYEQAGASNAAAVPALGGDGFEYGDSRWTQNLTPAEQDDLFVVRTFDTSPEAIRQNIARNEAFLQSTEPIRTINWYIPGPEHAMFAGVRTILRFAERLQEAHGIDNRIVIYNMPLIAPEKVKTIRENCPSLRDNIYIYSAKVPLEEEIPTADVSIATLWTSVYSVVPLKNTRATYYFIQDYEPHFYAGGTTSGVCEATYRMGLLRICNTPGLLAQIQKTHGGDGIAFVPTVDRKVYFPPSGADPRFAPNRKTPLRIFFYGRPKESRNGFLLGLEALRRIKAKYGAGIEIVAAGGFWKEDEYGVADVMKNLGRLASLEEVANLYRTCDIGLVFMFSKHPSYQPFEFMACGCAVVTNTNDATTWLLKDGENSLVTETTVASITETLGRAVEDTALRQRLVEGGYRTLPPEEWNTVIDRTCREARLLPPL
jgi:O-antigen biosynthesis protein